MTDSNLKLQYQICSGRWLDCAEQTESFLLDCEKFNGVDASGKIVPAFRSVRLLTRVEVISELLANRELRNDSSDWYSNCRSGSAYESAETARRAAMPTVKMVKCTCGHTVPQGSVMSASLGSSCPDCYDRLSN